MPPALGLLDNMNNPSVLALGAAVLGLDFANGTRCRNSNRPTLDSRETWPRLCARGLNTRISTS